MNKIKFAEILKELRQQKNLTQYTLADILKINRNVLAKWEQGKARPSYEMLLELSKVFNVPVGYLLGVED